MGEIKSTLDLVMEKTRHLSLTREEKAAQESTAMAKKINGLLVKYGDQKIHKDRFLQEIDILRANDTAFDEGILRQEILNRIGLDADDTVWIDLLKTVAGVDPAPLVAVVADYRTDIEKNNAKWSEKIREAIRDTYHATGSAVVPHLEADSDWHRQQAEIQAEYGRRLEKAKAAAQ